ncbi:hypothetical protein PG5_07190 [Pseudomonas sp. G5(2012)]|nr:hypothetical protein PG5_07190 [Pseudomonas sp. G5(2012)]
MLAMDVNDTAPCLDVRVVWKSIASRLAPTEERDLDHSAFRH